MCEKRNLSRLLILYNIHICLHPDHPNLKLSHAAVFGFFAINSDTLIEAGPRSGCFNCEIQCKIIHEDSRVCGRKRTIPIRWCL